MLVSEANRLRRRVVAAKFVTLLLEMGECCGGKLFLLVGKIEVCTQRNIFCREESCAYLDLDTYYVTWNYKLNVCHMCGL